MGCAALHPSYAGCVSGVGTSDVLVCIAVLSVEVCLMLNIGLAGNEFTMALQAANAELKSIFC